MKKIIARHVEILRSIPYFSDWSISELKRFNSGLFEVDFIRGNTVIKQNDSPSNVYIIKEGEFEILRLVNYTP